MKKLLIIIGSIIGIILVLIGSYVAYVFIDYYRLEDNICLEIDPAFPTSGDIPKIGENMRVISYNIGFGAYSDDYSFFMDGGKESRARSPEAVRENIGGAMASINEFSPDFIILQEVDKDGDRSYHIDEREIVKEAHKGYSSVFTQNYDSPYLFWPLNEPHGANKSGQLTLSRFPIASALRRSLPIETGFMKLVDLDRCYTINRIPMKDDKELILINFHLSAYTSDGKIPEDQLVMLFEDMQKEVDKGNYVIAGGDFNKDILGNSSEIFKTSSEEFTWAQPIPDEIIPEEFKIIAPLDKENPVASCRNADRPYGPDDYLVTVDGFIISSNIEMLESKVIDTGYRWSDHNPVYMDFKLK